MQYILNLPFNAFPCRKCCIQILPPTFHPILNRLQEKVPLGVDLRTGPLHGDDTALPEAEFGQAPPYVPKLRGLRFGGVFSGIANIFSDKQVDPTHKHYP